MCGMQAVKSPEKPIIKVVSGTCCKLPHQDLQKAILYLKNFLGEQNFDKIRGLTEQDGNLDILQYINKYGLEIN